MTHWTKEICQQEALKYQTKMDFYRANRNAYEYSKKYGFLVEICQHMIKLGNRKHKCVYCYEFPDNHVYVGITYNFFKRKIDREKRLRDSVTQYIIKTGLVPVHKQLTDYIKVEEAVFLEGKFVEEYRSHNWLILNKAKTGGVGISVLYWTKERCLKEGLKYTTKSDFWRNCTGAYSSARINGWLPEIHSHMKPIQKKWTKECCEAKALLCDTRTEFKKKYGSAYQTARINNWLNEICQHMKIIYKKPKGYWTLEMCIEDAKKYRSISEWNKNSSSAYQVAWKNGWLNECTTYMTKKTNRTIQFIR